MNNEENNLLNKQPANNNVGPEIFNISSVNDGVNFENSTVEVNGGINPETQNIGTVNTETVSNMPNFNEIPNQMAFQEPNMESMSSNVTNIPNMESNTVEMNQPLSNEQFIEPEVTPGVSSVPPVTFETNAQSQNVESINHGISQNIPNVPPVSPSSKSTLGSGSSEQNNNKGNNKYVPFLAIVAILVFVAIAYFTLFNAKTLECTITDSETGMDMKQTIKATFRNNSITKFGLTTTVTLDDDYKDYMDLFKDTFEEQFESEFGDYKDKKGVSMDTTTSDNIFTFNLEADLTKMDEETKEILDMTDNSETYEEVKASLKKEGYTCK